MARATGLTVALTACLTAAAVSSSPTGASAQEAREVDSGSFRILEGGSHVATERYAIRREGESLQSAARVSPAGVEAPAGTGVLEFRLQVDTELRPTFFEVTNRGPGDHGVVGVRSGNRLQLRSRSEEGERWQELLLAPGIVVVPRGLAHPYFFVVRILDSGQGPPLPAVAPDAGERRSLTVESRSSETVSVGGEQLSATLWELRIDGAVHRVWTDASGRVLRVEVPDRGWTAERNEPPGAAEGGRDR